MRRRVVRVALASLTLLCAFSLPARSQTPDPPFPRDGAKKVAENEYFAIWDVSFEKGRSTGMHRLPLDQVSVFLNDGPVRFAKPDGTWTIEQMKMGSVRYSSKGTTEAEEGAGDKPVRAVIFQLKDTPPPVRPVVQGVGGKFDGRPGATTLFETDRVTVRDYTWLKGMRTPRHLHYRIDASVYLVGGTNRTEDNETYVWKPGSVNATTTARPHPHVEYQLEGEARGISIELK